MPASFSWTEKNTIGEVETNPISNINFGSVDESNIIAADHPIYRGLNSYSKYIRILFTGSWTTIHNMKFWQSVGTLLTGESIKASLQLTYSTPVRISTGDSNIPTTEGTALSVLSAEGDSSIEYGVSGVSGYTEHIRLQQQTTVLIPVGATNTKTFTFQYDEI